MRVRRTSGEGYALDLSFTAPVAARNGTMAYGVEYTAPGGRDCNRSGGGGQPIERDVRRGERVHVTLLVTPQRGCGGAIEGHVVLGRQSGALSGPTYDKRTIGGFTFKPS